MRKLCLFVKLCLTAMMVFFASIGANAQVTIGAGNAPQSFSVLELVGEGKRGLRLPTMTTEQRDVMCGTFEANGTSDETLAFGLVIFNTTTRCLEYWNGTHWVNLCGGTVRDFTQIPVGSGDLSGVTCFDIGYSNPGGCGSVTTRADTRRSFVANSTELYTFTPLGDVTDVTFEFVNLSAVPVISSISQSGNNVTVTFNTALDIKARNISRDNSLQAELHVLFFVGTNQFRQTLTISVQDCSCGCSIRVPTEVNASGWLTFMCYNLGADASVRNMTATQQVAAVPDATHGWLFQWGRPADGHQVRTSETVATRFDGDTPTHGNFITTSDYPHDWRDPSNNNLWGDGAQVKSANDPCPSGWRVPTEAELQAIIGDASVPLDETWLLYGLNEVRWIPATGDNSSAGMLVRPQGTAEPALFLPAAGWRNLNGVVGGVGTLGLYWSSTPATDIYTNARRFTFHSSAAIMTSNSRVSGFSVRCVSE